MNGIHSVLPVKCFCRSAGAGLVLFSVLVRVSVGPQHLLERSCIREEMKDRLLADLSPSELTVFHLSGTEFKDLDIKDDGREMEVGGLMYDIVRIHGGSAGDVVVEAVRDDAEMKLMADLDRLVERQLNSDTRGQERRALWVSGWCVYHETIGRAMLGLPLSTERAFAELSSFAGRGPRAIDPGPPRGA